MLWWWSPRLKPNFSAWLLSSRSQSNANYGALFADVIKARSTRHALRLALQFSMGGWTFWPARDPSVRKDRNWAAGTYNSRTGRQKSAFHVRAVVGGRRSPFLPSHLSSRQSRASLNQFFLEWNADNLFCYLLLVLPSIHHLLISVQSLFLWLAISRCPAPFTSCILPSILVAIYSQRAAPVSTTRFAALSAVPPLKNPL